MGSGDRWFFDRVAPLYDLVMPGADRSVLMRGLGMTDGPVRTVLDVGGGTGRAARAITADRRIVLDASRGMLDRVPAPIRTVAASATDLPVRPGGVDAVLIVDALHHLPEPERVLSEVYAAIRPGGVVVIGEFDPGSLRGRLVTIGEAVMGFESTFWRPDALVSLVGSAGFDAEVLDRGFTYTVAGRKPSEP